MRAKSRCLRQWMGANPPSLLLAPHLAKGPKPKNPKKKSQRLTEEGRKDPLLYLHMVILQMHISW